MNMYNFSKDNDYHTQINNKHIPLKSCLNTSLVMAGIQAGIDIESLVFKEIQPEDALTEMSLSKETKKYAFETCPWAFDKEGKPKIELQTIHSVAQWVFNKFVGFEADLFVIDADLNGLMRRLVHGSGIAISGTFEIEMGQTIDHVVSLAGFILNSELNITLLDAGEETDKLLYWIIDDPYGDPLTKYMSHKGNNISIEANYFVNTFKPVYSYKKWAHIVTNVK